MLSKANQNSIYHKELMGESYVNIKYSDTEYTAYSAGTSVEYGGENYYLMEDYVPSYNSNTCGYDYDMKFMAWYYQMENILFKLNGYASEFTLTAPPSKFIDLLNENIGTMGTVSGDVDDIIPFITLTFNGTNCLEALEMIVKALDPDCNYYEWWSSGTTINIGHLGGGTSSGTLTVGTNVANVQVQKGGGKSIGTLYAYGGTRNLSRRYGAEMEDISASDEVESTNGEHVGYQDKTHIVKASMFRNDESIRVYADTLELANPSSATRYIKNHTDVVELIYELDKTEEAEQNNYNVLGYSILKFTNTSKVSNFYCHNDDTTNRSQIWVEMQFGVYDSANGKFDSLVTIGKRSEIIPQGDNKLIALSLDNEFSFFPIPEYTYAIKIIISGGYWSGSGFYADSDKGTMVSTSPSSFVCKVTSQNYAINAGNSFGLYNPCFYPHSSSESRCFEKSATGVPENLVKYKCPAYWFPITETSSYSGAQLTKRLTLDDPLTSEGGIAEAIVTFDDIYPSTKGTLTNCSVKSEEEEDTNGEKTGTLSYYYSFVDTKLKNISTEIFTEDTAKIAFPIGENTGALAGMEFELKLVKSDDNGTTFCIIPNSNYGEMLPNAAIPPSGDYVIVGIDISVYEQDGKTDLVADAKERLETLAQAYLDANNADQNVYTCTMICTATSAPSFGSTVTFNSNTTRVIGVQHPLDVPMADYQVTLGNSISYKRLAALERKTVSLK